MYPVIFIFGKEVGTYAICALVGILISGIYACKKAKDKKLDVSDFIIFLLICTIGVLIGGHILYGLTNFDKIILLITKLHKIDSIKFLFNCIIEIFGGNVFYGGLIGGIIAGIIYCKKTKTNIKNVSDICAPMVPLFHTFGRIGCFFGGCCFGIESKYGIYYDNSYYIKDVEVTTRFPVQLVEATCNFVLFLILNQLLKKNKFKGNLFLIYLISYSIIRFILEFFRGDEYRGFLFGLSTSQIISIMLFIISIVLLIIDNVKKNYGKKDK